MAFKNNIPQAEDFLNITSQPDLLGNMAQLDISFGVDHYPFSDASANNGFHNQVTTPIWVGGKPLPVANPVFFAFQDSANIGTLQYSAGTNLGGPSPNNNVPTPLTNLQSPQAGQSFTAGTPKNIFDFAGLPRAIATIYIANLDPAFRLFRRGEYTWDGTTLMLNEQSPQPTNNLTLGASGSNITATILILNTTMMYWTINFHRLQ
jgi:hypothetical protein